MIPVEARGCAVQRAARPSAAEFRGHSARLVAGSREAVRPVGLRLGVGLHAATSMLAY
jgi:hypothetical protein